MPPVTAQMQYLLDHPEAPCDGCGHALRGHLVEGKIVPCREPNPDFGKDPDAPATCGCRMEL